LLHWKAWLLALIALSGSGVLLLLLGLLLSEVRALIGKMFGLSTIVAYAVRKFLKLGTGDFPKAYSGMRSFSTAQMAKTAKTLEYAS
jgi:hypothetical protein